MARKKGKTRNRKNRQRDADRRRLNPGYVDRDLLFEPIEVNRNFYSRYVREFKDPYEKKEYIKRTSDRLTQIQDRRLWRPDRRRRSEFTVDAEHQHITLARRTKEGKLYRGLQHWRDFEKPFRAITCIRRKLRRKLMFIMGHAGRGKRNDKPRRWTEESNVRCL